MFTKSKLLPAVITYTLCYALLNLVLFFVFRGSEVQTWMQSRLGESPFLWLSILFVIQELVLIALVILQFYVYVTKVTKKQIWHFFSHQFHWDGWKVAVRVVGGSLAVYIALNLVLLVLTQVYNIHIPGLYGEQLVMTALEGLPTTLWWQKMLLILGVVIIGPLVEEIIYRGFLTKLLTQAVGWWGIVIAALLFAISHMEWGVVRNLFILALLLGYVYHKTQSLRYSFLFHVLINGIAVGVLFFMPGIK